eukprot:5021631-Amphidinium_carterae.2
MPSGQQANCLIFNSATNAVVGVWKRAGWVICISSTAGRSQMSSYAMRKHSCTSKLQKSSWCGLPRMLQAVAESLRPAMFEKMEATICERQARAAWLLGRATQGSNAKTGRIICRQSASLASVCRVRCLSLSNLSRTLCRLASERRSVCFVNAAGMGSFALVWMSEQPKMSV